MLQWLYSWLDRIFAVIGAFLLSQFPHFYSQYLQRAMGHLEELSHQLELMRQAASLTGKTLELYIRKFIISEDLDISHQGHLMQQMVDRASELSNGIASMMHANVFTRPFAFLGHVQSDIATSTIANFKSGLTFDSEGLIYALLGIFLGYGLFHLATSLLAGLWMLLTRCFLR